MKSYKTYLTVLTTMLLLVSTVFATSSLTSREVVSKAKTDKAMRSMKSNSLDNRVLIKAASEDPASTENNNNDVSRDDCSDSFTVYGSDPTGVGGLCWSDGSGYFYFEWTDGCLGMTLNYSAGDIDISTGLFTEGFFLYGFEPGVTETFVITFDTGSQGIGEATNDCASCEDLGQVTCWDGSCAASEASCPDAGDCGDGMVIDCVDTDCCPESWIGDGFLDCEEQLYGCDLTCYDNDGGDCDGGGTGGTGGGEGGCEEGDCPPGTYFDELGNCYDCSWCLETDDDSACDAPYDCCGMCGGSVDPTACGPSCEEQGLVTCWDNSCAASQDDCPDMGELLMDCNGNIWDNSNTQYAGDGDSDYDGCMDTVYDCVIDNGTCEDIAGECLDANGVCAGSTLGYDCPDGVIGAWTNDTLCDNGDFGLYANCEELCFDGGSCGTEPDPDCTIGVGAPACDNAAGSGDVNNDGASNVQDIILIVNYILGTEFADDCAAGAADVNGDGEQNVQDIILVVNMILDGRSDDASSARLINRAGAISIDADGYVGAVQMTLTHGADFSINLTDKALVADFATKGNTTTLVVVVPEAEELFTSNGEFEITEMIVANSSGEINVVMATEFSLMAAYPNPFNPSTTLSLNMPENGFLSVKVFNLMGKTVATLAEGNMDANTYEFTWNASDMPSGLYVVRAEAMGQVSSQKLMLLK